MLNQRKVGTHSAKSRPEVEIVVNRLVDREDAGPKLPRFCRLCDLVSNRVIFNWRATHTRNERWSSDRAITRPELVDPSSRRLPNTALWAMSRFLVALRGSVQPRLNRF